MQKRDSRLLWLLAGVLVLMGALWLFRDRLPWLTKPSASAPVRADQKVGPSTYRSTLWGQLMLYDGRDFILTDPKTGKSKTLLSLHSDHYRIDTGKDYVYFLDMVTRTLYVIDAQGAIVLQLHTDRIPLGIKALPNGRFVLHYTTDIKAEGFILYAKDGKVLRENLLGKRSIQFIASDPAGGFLVSCLVRDAQEIVSMLYLYDENGHNTYSAQRPGELLISAYVNSKGIVLTDPSLLVVLDSEYREKSRISAQDHFLRTYLQDALLLIQDGPDKIRTVEESGRTVQQKVYDQPIRAFFMHQGRPCTAVGNELWIGEKKYTFDQDIADAVPLDQSIALIFADHIRFIKEGV